MATALLKLGMKESVDALNGNKKMLEKAEKKKICRYVMSKANVFSNSFYCDSRLRSLNRVHIYDTAQPVLNHDA